ncbi:hypothetical protein G9A89_013634 [Geosiphon pyriformis]|nr:hypothetical protein G9A89_013634 [Geosiphon pyriformis]
MFKIVMLVKEEEEQNPNQLSLSTQTRKSDRPKKIYKDMVDATKDIRKMEITDNIYLLVQQLFKLIQQQNIEITINQQTIQYRDTRKIPKYKSKKKTENTIDKMVLKIKLAIEEPTSNLYTDKTKQLFNTAILQQLEQFVGKNNLTTQAKAIYWLHIGF